MLDIILMYWALPSLVTMLLLVSKFRRGGDIFELWSLKDFLMLLISSVLYPLSLAILLQEDVWPWLIKKRGVK